MKKLNKIVATDLDGTLFNADAEISERTLNALKLANNAGYHTVAVTGRSWRTAFDRLKPATGIDYIICSNGAYLYRQSTASISWSNTIAAADVSALISTIHRTIPEACFGWESESGLFFEPQFLAIATNPDTLEKGGNAGEPGTQALYKLFIRALDQTPENLLTRLNPTAGKTATLTTSGAPFLEATSLGTDKASSLARLASELGVSADNTIAFGDNLNDISMLGWAGTSVAMENAMQVVKEVAANRTSSNIDDGVARYLENLLNAE